jgi:Glycosyl transferase family 2
MLIVIPSYKRTDILSTVLRSVFGSEVSCIAERKEVIVVNNHFPSRELVEDIVGQFCGNTNFQCRAIHRDKVLAPIDSWFSAINEAALEDEVVCLLGDDDLMLPWGLQDRHREIVRHQADMLLSDFADRIYFFEKGGSYWMPNRFPMESMQEKIACKWDFLPAQHPEASFISNHCYRNTAAFRRGLDLALKWCDSQTWLERDVRTAMLPFYLPYAITIAGGRVASLKSKCVVRGAVAEEAIKSTYADGGNVAFYGLCVYDVFSNRQLPQYDERLAAVSALFKPAIIKGLLTILFDRSITLQSFMATISHSGIRFREFMSGRLFSGAITVVVGLVGLRGVRLRFRSRSKSLLPTARLFYEARMSAGCAGQ